MKLTNDERIAIYLALESYLEEVEENERPVSLINAIKKLKGV